MSQGYGWNGSGAGPEGGGSATPDWRALAAQHEREERRSKQLKVAGAVLATLLVAGLTATAVALTGPDGDDRSTAAARDASASPTASGTESGAATGSPAASPTGSASAGPSATASSGASARPGASARGTAAAQPPGSAAAVPPDPLTVISSASTDTAPISTAALFPARTLSVDGKTWTKVTEGSAATCWQATTGGLGDVLTAQGCRGLHRATYTSGNSAVTVGVAVLDDKARADAAAAGHRGQVQGLVTAGSIAFCTSAGCENTHGAVGRYGYYTVSGTVKPGGTTPDAAATAAGPDFANLVRNQLLARGAR
ncbi:hypothetical protein [Kitasatospora camelliae]|uniref:Neocarzinostatin family protein n=1 Tax=Kitasatospora camelliae TaxID=3156397 RepID=A0AAU8K0M4_9ACTN